MEYLQAEALERANKYMAQRRYERAQAAEQRGLFIALLVCGVVLFTCLCVL